MSDKTPRSGSAIVTSAHARIWLAILRIATGFVFLWAFIDKTFGLGYATRPERAWIRGGQPAQGFLNNALEGKPFASFFASLANPVSDWLFMAGMLGIGLAVVLGIGTRVAAVAGTVMMAFMYLAEATWVAGSTNPVIDSHLIYALVLIVIALTGAGDTLGLGKWWKNLGIVKKMPWLI